MSLYSESVASKGESKALRDAQRRLEHRIDRKAIEVPESTNKPTTANYGRVIPIWAIPGGVDDGTLSPKPFRPRLIDHRKDSQLRKANKAYRAYEVKRSKRFT